MEGTVVNELGDWTDMCVMACLFTVQFAHLSSGKRPKEGGQRLLGGWLSLLEGNHSSPGCVIQGHGMDGLGARMVSTQAFVCIAGVGVLSVLLLSSG
jgi:hypothetical protein